MVEVFITDILEATQAKRTINVLEIDFPQLTFHADFADSANDFPCRHLILRAEGPVIEAKNIIAIVNKIGYKCEVLEDKVCK